MATTAELVLNALEPFAIKSMHKPGMFEFNSPFRPGSNSHAMRLTVSDDGEHGAWYDHVSGQKGSLYELAQHLGVETHQDNKDLPKGCANLDEYAASHGTPAAAYTAAGWKEITHKGRKAMIFHTNSGYRYRYLDGNKPKFWHAPEYQRCWYELDYAIELALATCQPLVLCNGEPSVVAAQYHGVAATCMTGSGENRLPDDLLHELKSKYNGAIIVAHDNDKKGRTSAPELAQQLRDAEYTNVRAVDLGGVGGFDLADFCALHNDAVVALQRCKELGDVNADFFSQGVTASELRNKEFTPLKWSVQDILPEGCTLLAGKPKARKSWLALNIALAVALGGKALGHFQSNNGSVLYLDLESNQRRAKRRLESTLRQMDWPKNLHIFNEWPKLDAGGIELLDDWMRRHPDTSLIIVDVFQDIRAIANPKAQLYTDDRAAVEPLRKFATKYNISILIVHHTRKAKGDDVFDEISGSTGLTGGVDNIMVLTRDAEDADMASLAIRGRDIEFDDALSLKWDFDFCQWRVVTDRVAADTMNKERREILDILTDGEIHKPADIAEQLGKKAKNISKLLKALESEGKVACVGFGKYKLASRDDGKNDGGSGRSSGFDGSGGSGRSETFVPLEFPPINEAVEVAVEVCAASESHETPISTTSTTSTNAIVVTPLDITTYWSRYGTWLTELYRNGHTGIIETHAQERGINSVILLDALKDDVNGNDAS